MLPRINGVSRIRHHSPLWNTRRNITRVHKMDILSCNFLCKVRSENEKLDRFFWHFVGLSTSDSSEVLRLPSTTVPGSMDSDWIPVSTWIRSSICRVPPSTDTRNLVLYGYECYKHAKLIKKLMTRWQVAGLALRRDLLNYVTPCRWCRRTMMYQVLSYTNVIKFCRHI